MHVQISRVWETAGPIALKFGVLLDSLARRFTKVEGGVNMHVHRCRCAPFPYLGNGLTDCAESWYVVTEALARRFTKV